MKWICIFIVLICPASLLAQTISTGGVKNTQANSAYVTPVVTRTYSPKADPYTWDAAKTSFVSNSSYAAPAAGIGGNVMAGGGLKFALGQIFGRPRSEVKLEKLSIASGKRNAIIASNNTKIYAISSKITNQVKELAKNYDAGNYFDAMQDLRVIGQFKIDIQNISNEIFRATGAVDNGHRPSDEEASIEAFYSLLTYNRVGKDQAVLSEYLGNYTNCLDPFNTSCRQDWMNNKMGNPPFTNTCGFRECPELIGKIIGLPLEDIFEIELAFTESAALLGYTKFATENLNSIMNYYSGKVQLAPYYLYMASIQLATGQPDIAQQLYSQYKQENEKEPGQQLYLQLYLQKMALYFFTKGDSVEGRKYVALQLGSGYKSVISQYHLVSLLDELNFKKGRENKLITEWLLQELSSLLQNKEFIKKQNEYCNTLANYATILTQHEDYAAGLKTIELHRVACRTYPPNLEWRKLRCLTGDASSVIADFEKILYEKSPMEMGKSQTAFRFMEVMNSAGLYDKAIEVFKEAKKQGVKKKVAFMYADFEGEACIAYYGLKDYSNAKKLMNDLKKTPRKYKRYYAKLYAQQGDITKAKEIYESISYFPGMKFDEEDIHIMDQ